YKRDGSGDLLQNRLYNVNNAIASGPQDQLPNEGVFNSSLQEMNYKNNYSFDEIGELKKDSINQIDSIVWNLYGRVSRIYRHSSSSKNNLKFDYDPLGNRIDMQEFDVSGNLLNITYYLRDTHGNALTTYVLVNDNIHHTQTYSQV